MKSLLNLIAVLLIIFGIFSLAYNGFTYKSEDNVAKVGNVAVTAETQKTVYLSPMVGGLSLAAGIVLLLLTRRRGD